MSQMLFNSITLRHVTSMDLRAANRLAHNLTRLCLALLVILMAATLYPLSATVLPSGFVESRIANGIANPSAMAFAPDGRLFVSQQGGQLRVIKNGVLLTTPFVTIDVETTGEHGLLGVAFDPGFAFNGYIYVVYTAKLPTIHQRISRFTANGDVASLDSEVFIFEMDDLGPSKQHI